MEALALDQVIKEIGIRPLAYAIYSLLIRLEPQILIVDTDKEAEVLESFLNYLLGDVYGSPSLGVPAIEEPFKVIAKENYEKNWRKFVGKRLVFVKEDQALQSDAVENMKVLIEKSLKSKFPPPEERFKNVIEGTLTIINRVIGEIESRNGDLSNKKTYLDIIHNSIVFEEQVPLILELLKIRGYDLTS